MVRCSLIISFALLASLVIVDPVSAQGLDEARPNAAAPGAFQSAPHSGFSVVEPPEGLPKSQRSTTEDGSGRWFFDSFGAGSATASPERLFNEATQALEDGRRPVAQRLFERLIAESPNSSFASEARRQLGLIYSGGDAPAPQQKSASRDELPWAGEGARADAGMPDETADIVPALSREEIDRARVTASVDEQFLSSAGDRVFFASGKATLGTRAQNVIRSQARFLKKNPQLMVAVEGHADDGKLPDEEVLALSQLRAAAVRARLIGEGIAQDRITAFGRGREDKISDCGAPECQAQNRRAVTILLKRAVSSGNGPAARQVITGSVPQSPASSPTH